MRSIWNHIWRHRRSYVEVLGMLAAILALIPAYTNFRIEWPSSENIPLTVSPPEGGTVGLCATIHGTGKAPKGKQIWLAQHVKGSEYYFLRPVKIDDEESGKWSMHGQIGDNKGGGLEYVFQAIVIDKSWADWMTKINLSDTLSATALPPHSAASKPRTISRNLTDNEPCP